MLRGERTRAVDTTTKVGPRFPATGVADGEQWFVHTSQVKDDVVSESGRIRTRSNESLSCVSSARCKEPIRKLLR